MPSDVGEAAVRAGTARDEQIADALRTVRGVVHTPLPVARFVWQRIAATLEGWAELSRVQVVDPACGPGVFLAAAVEGGARRLRGFDVDADAIARAEGVLRPHVSEVRLSVRNTLAQPLEQEEGPLVILGNPPWSGRSANTEVGYTEGLLDRFRRLPDGRPLRERKIGVLSDDYVRFFAWATEQALRAPEGAVLAFVTNASYLDGPVHRAMRAAMAEVFASVEVVDLGGSALIARAGRRDENVFGVRPAAAVVLLRRRPGETARELRYQRVWGSRDEKLAALDTLPHGEIIGASPPSYRWVPEPAVPEHYATWPSLVELVPFHREGVQTNRDAMCVDRSREELLRRLARFAEGGTGMPGRADVPSGHYDPARARQSTRDALAHGRPVRPLAYRPLDDRHVATVPRLCHRPRAALQAAVDRSVFCLLTVRKDRGERAWRHVGASRHIADNCFISTRSSCRTRVFPTHLADGTLNLDRAVFDRWRGRVDASGDELLFYALAVLGARTYQDTYGPALMVDYPRLVPPSDRDAYTAVVAAGRGLLQAFEAGDPQAGPHVTVGHHTVRSAALAEAFEACDRAVVPILEQVPSGSLPRG